MASPGSSSCWMKGGTSPRRRWCPAEIAAQAPSALTEGVQLVGSPCGRLRSDAVRPKNGSKAFRAWSLGCCRSASGGIPNEERAAGQPDGLPMVLGWPVGYVGCGGGRDGAGTETVGTGRVDNGSTGSVTVGGWSSHDFHTFGGGRPCWAMELRCCGVNSFIVSPIARYVTRPASRLPASSTIGSPSIVPATGVLGSGHGSGVCVTGNECDMPV